MKRGIYIILTALVVFISGCGIYKFNATSVAPDVKTVSIFPIENRAMKVNPQLSNLLTIALQDKFRRLTKLEMVEEGGDIEINGYVMSYDVTPTAVTSQEVAAQNRLTITVKISFVNNKHEEDDLEQSFAAFQDYDSNVDLDSVEGQLVDEIIEILVEDIFNATMARW